MRKEKKKKAPVIWASSSGWHIELIMTKTDIWVSSLKKQHIDPLRCGQPGVSVYP